MEIDELKRTWQQLESRIEQQGRLSAVIISDRINTRAISYLRPLYFWQIVQIIAGVLLAGLGAQFWIPNIDQTPLLLSGLTIHAYGVALIINGIRVLLCLNALDYSAAVAEVQKKVVTLEKSYVQSGWILGLPWWLLWIPFSIVLLALSGFEVSQMNLSNWVTLSIVFGLIGGLATVAGFHWARKNRPELNETIDRIVVGASIDKAKQSLIDIEHFEKEIT